MAYLRAQIDGCCSVGNMYSFGYYYADEDIPHGEYNKPKSGKFIAVFTKDQHNSFKRVCRYHTCLVAIKSKGDGGSNIAICIFQWGKKK